MDAQMLFQYLKELDRVGTDLSKLSVRCVDCGGADVWPENITSDDYYLMLRERRYRDRIDQ